MTVTATRTARRAARRAALGSIIPMALLVGVMAGCSAPAAPARTHSAAAVAKATRAHDGTVTQLTHAPGSTAGYVGALKDVALTSCDASAAPARFGGTVTNPTSTAQSYRIYVSVLSAGDTLGVREVDVPGVAAHATQKWSATIAAGKAGGACVLRVERHG